MAEWDRNRFYSESDAPAYQARGGGDRRARSNRDRGYASNFPGHNRDRGYRGNAPRPNHDRGYTENAPRPNHDRGYTENAPRPTHDRGYPSSFPEHTRDRGYRGNAPRANPDRGYTENAPRENRERRSTENAPGSECDEYLRRCEELSKERDPSALIDFMADTEEKLDKIIDSPRLPITDIRSLVGLLTHPHFTEVTPQTLNKINAIFAKIPDTQFITSKYNLYRFIERNFSDLTDRISYQDRDKCMDSLSRTVSLLRTLLLKFQSEHQCLSNCIVLLSQEINNYDYELGPHQKEAIIQLHASLTKVSTPREKADTDQQVKSKDRDPLDSDDEEKDYGDPFRTIPIYPSYHEIRVDSNVTLRQLVREGKYSDVETYLDIHFKLLREDMVYPLKIAIKFLLELDIKYGTQLYTYDNVKLECISTHHQQGMVYKISFNPYGIQDRVNYDWKQSTRLKFGALVCISQKNNGGYPTFENPLWAVVTQSDEKEIKESGVISIKFKNGFERHFKFDTDYFMIESREVYFEAYCHILSCLQTIDTQTMPFAPILLGHANDCDPPNYIDNKTMLDFGDLIEGDSERVRVLCDWPPSVRLNDSQYAALKLAFTKKLALIQGPPGTGKTLVGFEIAKILLRTRKRELNARYFDKLLDESICKHPIFTITQSNHALDQFLEMIMEEEGNIVRIGGRSESEKVKTKTLFEIKKQSLDKNASKCPEKIKKLKREYWEIKKELDQRTKQIEDYSKELKILTNTRQLSLNQLKSVASDYLYKSLILDRPRSIMEVDSIVEEWLNYKVQKKENKPKNIPLEENPFAIIAGLDLTVPDDITIDNKYKTVERRVEYLDLKPEKKSVNKDIEPIQAVAHVSVRRKFALYDDDELEEWYDTEPDFEDCYTEPEFVGKEYLGEEEKETLFVASKTFKDALETIEIDATVPESILKAPNVWELSEEDRETLFKYWIDRVINKLGLVMKNRADLYLARTKDLEAISNGVDLFYLESAAVIGMTTTGAAKNSKLLSQLKPRIIIVEEAAEVLEAHILTSLCSSVEHLIMIGDHQQLRPNNVVFSLAKLYNLNLSLFERLVINGVHHVTLNCQHRMRPEISQVMKIIYPGLTDHDKVKEYPCVRGVTKNTFFISHDHLEDETIGDSTSKSNLHEAKMVVQLTLYLLKQGYEHSEITLLTFYNGQKHLLNTLLEEKVENHEIRITSVDKYQGEENRIVILSVVRGNEQDYIGHCAVDNRVCVAFSRAREGFFVIGNEKRLQEAGRNTSSKLWNKIIGCFKDSNSIGTALPLCCPTHNHIVTLVTNSEDFEIIKHGGCGLKCEFILPCEHMCPHLCHPGSHDEVTCAINCKNILSCSHPCPGKCGVDCTTVFCTTVLEINAPCGHLLRTACGLVGADCLDYTCDYKCSSTLPCGHPCTGTCGMCSGDFHNSCPQKCKRALICGHPCGHKCHFPAECPPCTQPCSRACVHSKCTLLCGDICISCPYQVHTKCQHDSFSIECRGPSTRPLCEEQCRLKLKCGHPCLGLCGEDCPLICRVCSPDDKCFKVYFGDEEDEKAKFIILPDCGHIFEVNGLDFRFKTLKSITSLPHCPECKLLISTSLRFHETVKSFKSNIDCIKKTMYLEMQVILIDKCSELNSFLTVRASNAISDEVSRVLPVLKRMVQSTNSIRLYPMSELLNIVTNLYNEFPAVLWTSCSPIMVFFRCEAFNYFLKRTSSFTQKEDDMNIHYLKQLYRQCPLYAMFQLIIPNNLSGKDLDLYSELDSKFKTLDGATCSEDELEITLGICEIFLYKLRGKYRQNIPVCHYDPSFRRNITDTSTEWNKCKNGHFYESTKDSSSAMCPYCNITNS